MATILVIDDDLETRRVIRRMLESAEYVVIEAENGRVGLASMQATSVDIIVTDMVMPEMEGVEMISTVRALWPEIPIVAISGAGWCRHTDFLPMATQIGADQVLTKPFLAETLLAAITSAVESRAGVRDSTA